MTRHATLNPNDNLFSVAENERLEGALDVLQNIAALSDDRRVVIRNQILESASRFGHDHPELSPSSLAWAMITAMQVAAP